MPETECALCKRMLKLDSLIQVIADVPDFCNSCYMARIHPKVEQIMHSIPTGQRMPDTVEIGKRVLSELLR